MMYLRLFWEFFKTGLFSVGGGLATIPFLYDIADSTGWCTHAQIADMIAISESTPGPIGVNMATNVGFSVAGVPGGLIATVGLVAPSVIVILIIARALKAYRNNRWVEAAFYGLRAASAALIASAGFSVVKISLLHTEKLSEGFWQIFDLKAIVLAAVLLAATNIKSLKKLHPVVWIGLSAVAGIVFRFAGV